MRKYLAELHNKPDHHKKRFALLTSSSITLFIFGIWSLATFGGGGWMTTGSESASTETVGTESEVSPFESLRTSVAASIEAVKDNFGELKSGMKAIDFESEYQEMRDGALNVYGQ